MPTNPKALKTYYDHKIMQLKEEGDTSQVCQLYDQDPAKKDKVALRSGLDMLRSAASASKGVIDQWALVACQQKIHRELQPVGLRQSWWRRLLLCLRWPTG